MRGISGKSSPARGGGIKFVITLMCLLFTLPAFALDTDRLPNQQQESRARSLMLELRCLVCQNESIAESNADLAVDLRTLVRQHVASGETNAQVKNFLVARYGDWVLLQPPLKRSTILLWAGPAIALLAGAALIMQRRPPEPVKDLTVAERAALEALDPK